MDSHPDNVNQARSDAISLEEATALVAQLYYDRADVARISSAAAAAMDVAITLVKEAVSARTLAMTNGNGNG